MHRKILGAALGGALLLLASSSASAGAPLFFKQEVKIPFALQSGSTVVEPGKYMIRAFLEGNNWFLTLSPSSKSNREVLRVTGAYADIPNEDRNFKELRLQIMREDDKDKGGKWVIFQLDIRNPGDNYARLVFRVQEATKE
ncbi:MAG TPA: hypothetical protein VJA25_08655 [Dehalococcoidia bacterium]|nr:hypothetical protein [Dehalococcoidia bacterium]